MSELIVLEVQITKVVTEKISGHTGGTSVVVLVHGDVFLGVDLEQAQFIEVEQERRHLVLSLPPPTVRRVAIDHRTNQVLHSGRQGLWRLAVGPALEDQAIAKAFILGEQRLQDAAERTHLINRAMHHAESAIGRFADETEWTLEVRWAE